MLIKAPLFAAGNFRPTMMMKNIIDTQRLMMPPRERLKTRDVDNSIAENPMRIYRFVLS
jgi:hypothetical protein